MIRFYFDDDSGGRAVIRGLQAAGFAATRTIEAGTAGWTDEEHLAFAAQHGFAVVTSNRADFVVLHTEWLTAGRHHSGIVIAEQRLSIGERIVRLTRLAKGTTDDVMRDRIEFLYHWGEDSP